MNTNLNPQNFRSTEIKNSRIIDQIKSGKAILFVGSGFSRNTLNIKDSKLPTAEYLAEMIGELGKFDADKDLKYAAEKFIRDNNSMELIEFIKDTFTIKKPLIHQEQIVSQPWKRIYTTNYDLCIEEAGRNVGKRIETVEINDDPKDYLLKKNSCIHINGSINSLNSETLNTTFKLSSSSYLSADSFSESYWHLPFKRDLETCSAIVFIGYSLYDIEIQKILYQNTDFSEKTYFITAPNASERERFTLSPYGDCFTIGAEEFGKILDNSSDYFSHDSEPLETTSIIKYKNSEILNPIRDSEVDRFLMFGDVQDETFESALFTQQGAPLLIKRKDISTAINTAISGNNVAILGDFGNGKTVFLRIMKSLLSQQGFNVYTVENSDEFNLEDFQTIADSSNRAFIFIDSYEQHLELIRFFYDLSPKHINLILATRSSTHERIRPSLNINFDEFFIDELDRDEVDRFVEIIDDVGFWDSKSTTLSKDAKISLINKKHDSQIQQTLLSILQAPQMVSRVKSLLDSLFKKKSTKKTIFSMNLLSAMDYPLQPSLISEISENNDIYKSELRDNQDFKQLFNIRSGKITSRSSLTSIALIRNNFPAVYVVDELLAIVTKLNNNRHDRQQNDLLKSLLMFSSVERLFPEKQRINNLARYYEDLKRRVTWLKNDPHYWLQYAMALLAYDDFSKTQRMLNQAYEWAEKKPNYHTVHIDMQQCKLYLKMSLKENSNEDSFKLFKKGMEFINKVPNDIKKFRIIEQINNVFNAKYSLFTESNQREFINLVEKFKKEYTNFKLSPSYNNLYLRSQDYVENKMERIIRDASNNNLPVSG